MKTVIGDFILLAVFLLRNPALPPMLNMSEHVLLYFIPILHTLFLMQANYRLESRQDGLAGGLHSNGQTHAPP